MPRYVVERSFAQITDEEFLAAAVRSDRAIGERFPEITWEHSHVCVDEDGGITTFCVYEAPDEEAISEHAEAFGGHSVARIYELLEDLTPLDVRRRAGAAGL
jgi:ligand-binding SRPBCC domain-containing protein